MKPRDAYPLELHLPSGIRAQLVAGSRPPKYTVDGQPIEVDVTIPDDLAAAGWIWHGSFLYQPYPGREDGPGVGIATCTFGVEGSFEGARRFEAKRAEVRAMLAARPPKKVKAGKRTIHIPDAPIEAVPEPELVAEQMELAL